MSHGMIIFDFDGVLADSFNYMYMLNKMAMAKFSIDLSESQYRDFFMGNIHAAFRDFIKDDGMYNKFSEVRQQNFDKYYSSVELFSGAIKFLDKIKEKFILTIASSGKRDRIIDLLKANDIENFFQIIAAGSDHSKDRMINEIMKELEFFPEKTIFISDTYGDLILAKKLNLKAVGVSWGFQSSDKLSSASPDFIAKDFADLFEYLIVE